MTDFRKYCSIKVLPILMAALAFHSEAGGQTHLYFQDSENPDYYEYSWMEVVEPSELERMQPPELRRFPVESVIPALQGVNSLRLQWRSADGGNWFAIAAGTGWQERDISNTDTMSFWLQSPEGIDSLFLPHVFVEDITNRKSIFIPVSEWSDDLAAGVWTRITIPMGLFLNSGDGVDYTVIKTIGFAQDSADGAEHTLLIDDMRIFRGDGTFPPVDPPDDITATPYEKHIEISWEPTHNPDVAGYQVERSLDGGVTFEPVQLLDSSRYICVDWVGDLGDSVQASYRVASLNAANEPSDPSDTVTATTFAMTDEELLDMVQLYTFRYFWDFAHPVSGLSRERNTSGNTVTSGGSGFGLMAIPVGIERGYITREEGADRVHKILDFLEAADRFHGAWSHWLNGITGDVIPFSTFDNGGDIAETAYMAQGLLTIRQYFDGNSEAEQQIAQKATTLWEEIEWDWYRRDNSPAIYWHWSPGYEWQMNMRVTGWNEAAIVYLLAVASPTYGVPASLWHTGWAGSPGYVNGESFYGHELYVGPDWGGPLFFAHYSFLGFDPRNKADSYANYFEQNRNHSLIQQAYGEDNPKGFAGYSAESWGLTASDDPDGYMAHEPHSTRDNGTITPSAALSSFPYTPEASMLALKHFYREQGKRIWDWMGFKDAFNLERNWFADSYLAIDQGPIILMIENHRSGLLWDLFMANPEIMPMMDSIGFHESASSSVTDPLPAGELHVYPNPSGGEVHINFRIAEKGNAELSVWTLDGVKVRTLLSQDRIPAGEHHYAVGPGILKPGAYLVMLSSGGRPVAAEKIIWLLNNEERRCYREKE
jgi:hypothetical protein